MTASSDVIIGDQYFIIGAGVVGQATAAMLDLIGCDATFVDIDKELTHELRLRGRRAEIRPTPESHCITAFLCVPTPLHKNGSFDLNEIYSTIRVILDLQNLKSVTLVLRSTVLPGTCSEILDPYIANYRQPDCEVALVYMPEFVRAATALDDAVSPRAIVLASESQVALKKMIQLFDRFADRLTCLNNPTEAEMMKIVHNAFNASKISFWNEMFRIGTVKGLNMELVSKMVSITAEASWNPDYGLKGGAPFGGACLPKDLAAFISHANEVGIEPHILRAVHAVNEGLKSRSRQNFNYAECP